MASSIILGNVRYNVNALLLLLVWFVMQRQSKDPFQSFQVNRFQKKRFEFLLTIDRRGYSISAAPIPSPSPTSQGSQYLAILPSVCMSHGWTNMEQPSSSAACGEETLQDQHFSVNENLTYEYRAMSLWSLGQPVNCKHRYI